MKTLMASIVIVLVSGCASSTATPRGESFLVTLPLTGIPESNIAGASPGYYREGRWRAPLRTRQWARQLADLHDLRQIDAWPIEALNLHCVLYEAVENVDLPSLFAALENDERVVTVQPNAEFEGMTARRNDTYNDPLFELQYGKNTASIRQLHSITRGETTVVGLIDSNVDLEHPDLVGQITKYQPLADSNKPGDQLHGTAMAGIIAALPNNGEGVVGIAPAATLHAYGACRRNADRTTCRTFDIAKAIAHAIDDHVNVLNISLAGPRDDLLTQLLTKAATDHDMVIVAARNDDNPKRNFPANIGFVHAASRVDSLWFARYAQMSTQAGGGYQLFYGSSVASAGVAGIAALLRSTNTARITNLMLEDLLQRGCSTPLTRNVEHEFELGGLCD